jgi:hypothetical protein
MRGLEGPTFDILCIFISFLHFIFMFSVPVSYAYSKLWLLRSSGALVTVSMPKGTSTQPQRQLTRMLRASAAYSSYCFILPLLKHPAMPTRRTHSKSRNGCVGCKKRHVKVSVTPRYMTLPRWVCSYAGHTSDRRRFLGLSWDIVTSSSFHR